MWLIQIFDLHADSFGQVEDAIRAMDGVVMASGLHNDQPYVVAECSTEGDAMRIQHAVAAVEPSAVVVSTCDGAGAVQEVIGL